MSLSHAIHPSTILAALVIGAVLGLCAGLAVFPDMPIVAGLSCAAIVVSVMALGLSLAYLLEWRQTEKKLRNLREGR